MRNVALGVASWNVDIFSCASDKKSYHLFFVCMSISLLYSTALEVTLRSKYLSPIQSKRIKVNRYIESIQS